MVRLRLSSIYFDVWPHINQTWPFSDGFVWVRCWFLVNFLILENQQLCSSYLYIRRGLTEAIGPLICMVSFWNLKSSFIFLILYFYFYWKILIIESIAYVPFLPHWSPLAHLRPPHRPSPHYCLSEEPPSPHLIPPDHVSSVSSTPGICLPLSLWLHAGRTGASYQRAGYPSSERSRKCSCCMAETARSPRRAAMTVGVGWGERCSGLSWTRSFFLVKW